MGDYNCCWPSEIQKDCQALHYLIVFPVFLQRMLVHKFKTLLKINLILEKIVMGISPRSKDRRAFSPLPNLWKMRLASESAWLE